MVMNSSISVPAFTICLDREVERKRYIAQHLSDFNIAFEFSNAVDGRMLSLKQKNEVYASKKAELMRGRKLADGEIGCFLSHYTIWQEMIKKNIATALVVESDAVFCRESVTSINALTAGQYDWELVMLYYRECFPSFWGQERITPQSKLVRFANKCSCTTAYLLTLSGAKKLVEKAMPICLPVDDYMTGGFINKGIDTFAVYPRTIHLTEDNEETSTIKQGVNSIKNLTENRRKKIAITKKAEKRVRYFSKQLKPGPWL